jgi:hypothetical protein
VVSVTPTLLGLSGFAGAGKDRLAAELAAADPRWRRVAFADPLREMVAAIDPTVRGAPLSTWLKVYDWDAAKRHPLIGREIRRILQDTGLAVRDIVGSTTWVDIALGRALTAPTVITDVRFRNEAQAIRDRGGMVVRVDRPGVGPANSHVSEHDLAGFDFDLVIVNDREPADMLGQLRRVVQIRQAA